MKAATTYSRARNANPRTSASSPMSAGGIASSINSCTGCSILMRFCVMLAFALITFMMGVTVGLQYFDSHTVGPAHMPPGLVAGPPTRLRPSPADVTSSPGHPREPVEGAPADSKALTDPETWSVFTGKEQLMLAGVVDDFEVSGGAWIYVDPTDTEGSIQTVMSTRYAGCAQDADHRGYTFHVNNWETSDRALVLEWRDARGCARISSEANSVPVGVWTHVGFAFQGPKDGKPGKAMLFLNGKLLRTAPNTRTDDDVQSTSDRFSIGGTPDKNFFFKGWISQVFVSKGVITPRQLNATYRLTDAAGWLQLATFAKDKLLAAVVLSNSANSKSELAVPEKTPVYQSVLSKNIIAELTGQAEPRGVALVSGQQQPPTDQVTIKTREIIAPPAPKPVQTKPQLLQPPQSSGSGGGGAVPQAAMKIPSAIRRTEIPGQHSGGAAFDFTSGGNQWVTRMMRVPADQATGSVDDPAALAAGTFSDEVTQSQLEESDKQGRVRAVAVKKAMQHVWKNYKARAWGYDELKPRGGHGDNNWAGVGMTLVDSLDTLWVMDMKEEFEEAKEWVKNSLDFNKHGAISVFEVTIRVLGGLLAAYDLSKDRAFLDKAKDLGDKLLPAFNTPTGIPRAQITLATGWTSNPSWTGGSAILAELGTLQVEFRYLSKATGQPHYGEKAEAVIKKLEAVRPSNGLYPIYVSADTGTPTTGTVTFGALGDSFYEYLVKVWVQGGRKEPMYRRMYDQAMDGMTRLLLKRSRPSNLAYVADWDGGNTQDKMDHLVCFVPGMLALGAFTAAGTDGEEDAVRDLINAKALAYTCYQMYARQATGIAPEFVEFPGGQDLIASPRAPFYILRPEAAEALYILHQLTGNPIYREWGWKMFSAIEQYCKTEYGYGAHPDVRDTGRVPDDRMESFFLAETLKYLYMLQSPDHTISLEKYVFNTEAHPLSIFE